MVRVISKGLLFGGIVFLFVVLCSCGSSGGDGETGYSGIWDIRYNLIEDGCHLVLFPIPGYVDQYIIEESGGQYSLNAASELIVPDAVVIQEDGDLFAEDILEGDIFDDGSYCVLTTQVSMTMPSDQLSDTMFTQAIECNDGYSCVSKALGSAARQPISPVIASE